MAGISKTGAYALLAARAKVIVLVDCGADPNYQFGDLENLVRKARIDLQAEILFQHLGRAGPPTAPNGEISVVGPVGLRVGQRGAWLWPL